MNTLEQLVAFLPAMWIFALVRQSALGGDRLRRLDRRPRIIYAVGYWPDAKKRHAGLRHHAARAGRRVDRGARQRGAGARLRLGDAKPGRSGRSGSSR